MEMGAPTQYSAIHLISEARVNPEIWNQMPPEEIITRTVEEIKKRGIRILRAKNSEEALKRIKEIIPSGSVVMNGSSTTLIEIGYQTYVESGKSGWIDFHTLITNENDDAKRNELRRKSVTADYFLSGVNAIAETGELVSCDKSGSRVGAWPFGAGHLILVAGINKIVPTLADAFMRVREYALPLENARAKKVYGIGSQLGKCVILVYEQDEKRSTLILINESLGY